MNGLTEDEAKQKLLEFGENYIPTQKKRTIVDIIIDQLNSPFLWFLLFAAAISYYIEQNSGKEDFDSLLILIIVFFSVVLGAFQDYKAERTLEALRKLSAPKSKVIRDGRLKTIESKFLVPGDLLVLEEGDIVGADAVILQSDYLKVNESMLTGESNAVEKKPGDEVFMNTAIYSGNAIARVVRTGMRTKLGEIAEKLKTMKEDKTPFKEEIHSLSTKLTTLIIFLTLFLFIISSLKYDLVSSLLVSVSLAVAAIPESLPAVIVISLAVGAREMAKKNILVRKLSVIESLGSVDVICTDKTGTLTKNEMEVVKVFSLNKLHTSPDTLPKPLIECNLLCNTVKIVEKSGKKEYFGDPTETALVRFVSNFKKPNYLKVLEIPFSSERKMMSVVYKNNNKFITYSKGAPEILLKKCTHILKKDKITLLSSTERKRLWRRVNEFSSKGLRVLAFAFKETNSLKDAKTENHFVFLGLQALIDPPREGVSEAIKECYNAGIRVIMMTGDNSKTAEFIASKIGLKSKGSVNGTTLDKIDDNELSKLLKKGVNIFTRVSPFHKLRILKLLKKNHRVAMTGDGVNDVLALKKADVGIAMGKRGTEVAKEASDLIILDDNFKTIKDAVKEGRRIFLNIRKLLNYLLTSNLAEVGVIFLSTIFLSLEEPIFLPIHLLWINLLTDGLPALALGFDPAPKDIMNRPPRKQGENLINQRLKLQLGLIGIKKILIIFSLLFISLPKGFAVARTVTLTAFILYEFIRISVIRKLDGLGWTSNKYLLLSLILSLMLHMLIVYTPLSSYFGLVPLTFFDLLLLLAGGFIGYFSALFLTHIINEYTSPTA